MSVDKKLSEILQVYYMEGYLESEAIAKIKEVFGYEDLKPLEERKAEFRESIRPYVEKYGKEMCLAFFTHWSEHGPKDKKMAFEKGGKAFHIGRRLATWSKNQRKFSIVGMLNRGNQLTK